MTDIIDKTPPADKAKHLFAALATKKPQAEALLSAMLARAVRDGPFTEILDVTPDLAKLLLARNSGNRVISQQLIDGIASDIRDGRWVYNGETMIVAISGELNDGQHRCRAIVQAGISVLSNVAFGTSRESRLTVDGQQKTRVPGDYLAMEGFKDAHSVAAAAAYIWQIEKFGEIPLRAYAKHVRPTKQQIFEIAHRYRADLEEAFAAAPRAGSQKIASHTLLAVTYLLLARTTDDQDGAKEFIARVVDGADLSANSPIYVVRERLLKDKQKQQFTPRAAVELMLRGWNAHRRKLPYSKAQLGDNWPKIAK